MSCCNIYLFAEGIVVWTDGAAYSPDGVLMQVGPKVGLLPHLSAVVTTRGPAIATPLLVHYLGMRFDTFEELVDGLADAVAFVVDFHGDDFANCSHGGQFEIFVAGWRREGIPEAYRVSSLDPDDVQRLTPVSTAPGDQAVFDRMKVEFPGIDDNWLDKPHIGLRIMELQREIIRAEQVPGHGEICGIGGFAQMTVIARNGGIGTHIVKRWPDRIGEPIGSMPEQFAASGNFGTGGQTLVLQ